MVLGTVLSAAQNLLAALQRSEIKEVGDESEIQNLIFTVRLIMRMLREVETEQELSLEQKYGILQLKDAVFEADDLFDELVTLAKPKQLLKADGSLAEKVSDFFSSKNPVKNMKKMLKAIKNPVKNMKKKLNNAVKSFSFHISSEVIRRGSKESDSYVNEAEIIGREDELEYIVGTLLASDDQKSNVSVLSIVGIGGLGKTALAQLVYNDPRVTNAFPLKIWTCVSDHDQTVLQVSDILCKILTSITHKEPDKDLNMYDQFRAQLLGNKYLLVLDDVWTEDHHHWCELAKYLIGVGRGSYIVVTTRSQKTASITGGLMYELSGLSEENSWLLFKKMVHQSNPSHDYCELVRVGKNIIDGCAGVPLAIRMAVSSLYDQDIGAWTTFQWFGLLNAGQGVNDTMLSSLKRSYHHLESRLKSCFSYFALFPKDHVIKKEMLISLWMAQGYIVQSPNDESLEVAAQEYFSILMQRCFLQVVEQDVYGEIISCKLHDLIHDLACHVAGEEMWPNSYFLGKYVGRQARHVKMETTYAETYFSFAKIRSFLNVGCHTDVNLKDLIKTCMCVRTLDLSNLGIKSLPDSISKLLHLRYLDLSQNRDLEELPKNITKLLNLETLILNGCNGLAKLPEDLCRLVQLRALDIEGCFNLSCMPFGIGKLTRLCTLTAFVLCNATLSLNQWFDQLEDLEALQNLRGHLAIRILSRAAIYAWGDEEREAAYLRNKEYLKHITYDFIGKEVNGGVDHGKLMGVLQPNSKLMGLDLCGYDRETLPCWITLLRRVVRIRLKNCRKLQYLPYLGHLFQLKVLHLENLLNLEYIFEYNTASASGCNTKTSTPTALRSAEVSSVFPSLEQLHLNNLPQLKGWFRSEEGLEVEDDHLFAGIGSKVEHLKSSLPGQKKLLFIKGCPNLKYVPQGFEVEEFSASGAGISLTKEAIDRATEKTHDLRVVEEIEEDSSLADPSLSLNVHPPLIPSLPNPVIADDATYSPPLSSDDMVVNDALLHCALFPPDFEFEKSTLLQLWAADGIFHEEPIEEEASRFFEECLSKEYFKVSRIIFATGETLYTFKNTWFEGDNHLVSGGSHVARIEDTFNSTDLSPEVSYVSIRCQSLNNSSDLCQFEKFKQLRTLIFLQGHVSSFRQIPRDFFLSLNLLRVLDLSHIRLVELPSSIGNMKSLRYLDLTKTLINHLPEALDCLENLQTLKLRGCSDLRSLPKGMRKLEKLRHLEFDVLRQLRSMPEGMGALTNIRTLSAFIVGVEEGHSIKQLKNMNYLSGSFCISGLHNVVTEAEAVEANLGQKSHLRKLELRWSDSQDKDVDGYKKVISSLEPNATGLEELRISCFGGSELPLWICNTAFSKLVSITLFKCENCVVLPSVGLLPALKSLDIVSFKKLKVIGHNFCGGSGIQGHIAFPMLEKVVIQNMSSLEEWRDTGNSNFPRLHSLSVKECPNLFSLCTLSSLCSLKTLEITHCGMLASCLDEELPPLLKTFIIEECPLISSRILEVEDEDRRKLLAKIPNVWIDHEEISGLNSAEEEDDESD